MMNIQKETAEQIYQIVGGSKVRLHEPMKNHTTMKAGGEAAIFVTPESQEEIVSLVSLLREKQMPYYVLGNGSNVIVRDEGYDGVMICLADRYQGFHVTEGPSGRALVYVKSGTDNKAFSDAMISKGLAGFEFASGIPGSIGGATAMNAGAYDGEMKQIIRSVKILDTEGNIVTRKNAEMEFGYRHSLVSDGNGIVLETVLELYHDDPEEIRMRVDDLTARRQAKQPLEYPSCGSTFKRPEGYFAGKLISDAGLKGVSIGGAQVSEKHAGFVINRGNATAKDILDLIDYIRKQVLETQGVKLECEIKIL